MAGNVMSLAPMLVIFLARSPSTWRSWGWTGIDAAAGATAHYEGEASINRLMARQAGRVVIVADSSKAGRRAFARICTAREIDTLVTDAGIAAEDMSRLRDAGVDVAIA